MFGFTAALRLAYVSDFLKYVLIF